MTPYLLRKWLAMPMGASGSEEVIYLLLEITPVFNKVLFRNASSEEKSHIMVFAKETTRMRQDLRYMALELGYKFMLQPMSERIFQGFVPHGVVLGENIIGKDGISSRRFVFDPIPDSECDPLMNGFILVVGEKWFP